MGPLGELIQCPNLSENNLGFAGLIFVPSWGTGGAHRVGGRGGGRKLWPDFSGHTVFFLCGIWGPVEGNGSALPQSESPARPAVISCPSGKEEQLFWNGEGGEHGVSTVTP